MQFLDHPFYVELMPESMDELRVAQETFGVKGITRTVMVPAANEAERGRVKQAFRVAMSVKG